MLKIDRLLFVSSIILCLWSVYLSLNSIRYLSWEPVEANLEYLHVIHSDMSTTLGKRQTTLAKYKYEVNGISYVGTRILPLEYIFTSSDINQLFHGRQRITVYYDPKNHQNAVLLNRYPFTALTMLYSASFFLFLIGLYGKKLINKLILNLP